MNNELTKEAIAEAVASAVAEEVKKLQKPITKFKPGEDAEITVTKDEADRKFASLGEQLMAIKNAYQIGRMDSRLRRLAVTEAGITLKATGLGESVPADGGFLVEQEFVAKLLERTYGFGTLAARCTPIQVGPNFNGIKMPAVNETSLASSRFGGIVAYWGAEAGIKVATLSQFRQVSLELKKLTGLCYATDELLEDATALESWILKAFPMEFGFQIDDAIINGTGVGRPLGILNSPCLVSVAKETGQAAATVNFENIKKMWSRMFSPSRANAIWLINQDLEPELMGMSLAVGTGGMPVYLPANGAAGQPNSVLMARPVVPIWQCATLGTVGDIILADLGQYLIARKGGMQAASSIHVKFIYDETAFRFVMRLDGQPWWNSALTPYKGSNTQSPFVALATRA